MEEPLTEELLNELLDSKSPEQFLGRHDIGERRLCDYLQELLVTHGLKRKDVVRAAHVNETYGYQIFTGSRDNPSRDFILALAFAMGLSLKECDRLLQAAGKSRLYCKERRDAIIIFCLDHKVSLEETDDTLFSFGVETISKP